MVLQLLPGVFQFSNVSGPSHPHSSGGDGEAAAATTEAQKHRKTGKPPVIIGKTLENIGSIGKPTVFQTNPYFRLRLRQLTLTHHLPAALVNEERWPRNIGKLEPLVIIGSQRFSKGFYFRLRLLPPFRVCLGCTEYLSAAILLESVEFIGKPLVF